MVNKTEPASNRKSVFNTWHPNQAIPSPIAAPAKLPSKDKVSDSIKNSRTISTLVAPIDFLMPISFVLSLTAASITVIIPNPATTMEMLAMMDKI